MRNLKFFTEFFNALTRGKVTFSRSGKKIEQLHTVKPEPGVTYFILRLDGFNPPSYVKVAGEDSNAVIYQITPGKYGAAIFNAQQVGQFRKDFPGNSYKTEPYVIGSGSKTGLSNG